MSIPLRPFGIIKTLIDTIGLDISFAYDDLVFIEHNAFLLQMGEKSGADLGVWFNEDSTPTDRPGILSRLQTEGAKLSLDIYEKGTYSLNSLDGSEEMQLEFKVL